MQRYLNLLFYAMGHRLDIPVPISSTRYNENMVRFLCILYLYWLLYLTIFSSIYRDLFINETQILYLLPLCCIPTILFFVFFIFLIQLNSCQLMICDILIRITSLNYSFFVVHDNKKLISEFLVEERTGLHFRRFKLYNTSLKKVLSSAKL